MLRTLHLAWARTNEVPFDEVIDFATAATRAALMTVWGKRNSIGSYPADVMAQFYTRRRPPYGTHILAGLADDLYIFAAGHASVLSADGAAGGGYIAAWGIGRLFIVVVMPKDGDTGTSKLVARQIMRNGQGSLKRVWSHDGASNVVFDSAKSSLLTRASAAHLTQFKSILFGAEPRVASGDPTSFGSRFALPDDQLIALIIPPEKSLPPLDNARIVRQDDKPNQGAAFGLRYIE